MKKKLLSVLLSTAMVASLLVGCGSSAATDDSAATDAAATDADAAAGGAAHSRSGPRRTGLDLQLRPDGQHGQVLRELRQAGSGERERVDVQLRREEHGQVLLELRQARARRRVDLRVRHEEQRQILLGVRQTPARRQVRQLRLCTCRPGQPAQVLPRVRQALWGLRGV